MIYKISLDENINFAPETEIEEIAQCVRTILTTRKGTVPLDRDFGLSWEHIDKPIDVARILQKAAIIDALAEYEPRVRVENVVWNEETTDIMDGLLYPTVYFSIVGENDIEEDL